jgi:hypothetical protein
LVSGQRPAAERRPPTLPLAASREPREHQNAEAQPEHGGSLRQDRPRISIGDDLSSGYPREPVLVRIWSVPRV